MAAWRGYGIDAVAFSACRMRKSASATLNFFPLQEAIGIHVRGKVRPAAGLISITGNEPRAATSVRYGSAC